MWYAHSTAGDRSRWEPLRDHLEAVAMRASGFAEKFGSGALAQTAGLLHDVGKYDPDFLARLAGGALQHDHSTAGACMTAERFGAIGKLLAYVIAGHHAGLANGVRDESQEQSRGSLDERLKRGSEQARAALSRAAEDGMVFPTELDWPLFHGVPSPLAGFQQAFLVRMLFSCLVDADFLETERFYVEASEIQVERPSFPRMGELQTVLDAYMAEKVAPKANASPVNRLRADILAHVRAQAERDPGVFTLTVPTGGGKTLTSLAFALDHAERHGLDRIVYVIPFTSVIEQTAGVFRDSLGAHHEVILEHHSAFDETKLMKREGRDKLRLAMENWDSRSS